MTQSEHDALPFGPSAPDMSQFYTSTWSGTGQGRRGTEMLDEAFVLCKNTWTDGTRYRIDDAIAMGGMGAILLAWDKHCNRHVAMKVLLRADQASPLAQRFMREARTVAHMEHPNIVPVHDIGDSPDGAPYFAMKYVKGETLGEILQECHSGHPDYMAKYPLQTLLRIFMKVIDAVAFAHSRNIIHLDLKPGNILVGNYGEVLVLDWGLARNLNTEEEQSDDPSALPPDLPPPHSGPSVVGTPGFMAPEQALGKRDDWDKSTDIYSLGAILYMILTGKCPIVGENSKEILKYTRQGNFVPPGRRRADTDIPRQLEAVVMKAMAHKQQNRYQHAQDIRADVVAHMEGYAISEDTGILTPLTLLLRRRRLEARLIAVSAVIILCLAGLVIYLVNQSDSSIIMDFLTGPTVTQVNTERMNDLRARLDEAEAAADKAEGRARASDYLARIRRADAALQTGRYRAAAAALKLCPPELRGWEWGRMQYLCNRHKLSFPISSTPVTAAMNVDGSLIAASGRAGPIILWNGRTGKELRRLAGFEGGIVSLALSGDGRKLVTAGNDSIVRVWNVDTAHEDRHLTGHTKAITSVAISDDGAVVAAGSWDMTASVWDSATGERLHTLRGHSGVILAVALSADGRYLVTGSGDRSGTLWDLNTGRVVRTFKGLPARVTSVAVAANGSRVLVAFGTNDRVSVWHSKTKRPLFEHKLSRSNVIPLAFSRDGTLLSAAASDGIARLWDTRNGSLIRTFKGHVGPVIKTAISKDKTTILTASHDRTIRLWDMDGGRETRLLSGHSRLINGIGISPDSRRVIAAGHAGTIHMWDLKTGRQLESLPDERGIVTSMSFAPNGSDILTVTTADKAIHLHNVLTRARPVLLKAHKEMISDLAASGPKAGLVITGSFDLTAKLWYMAGRKPLKTLSGHEKRLTAAAISFDGTTAATGDQGGSIIVWNTNTGSALHTLSGHEGPVNRLAMNADGSRIYSAGADHTIRAWDAASGELIKIMYGHTGGVIALSLSSDGQRLISGSWDKSIRVWDAEACEELIALNGHKGAVGAVALSKDSRYLVSAGSDGEIRVWDTQPWAAESR